MTNRLNLTLILSLSCAAVLCAVPGATRAAVNQPLQIIDRPRTLPAGELELNGGVDLAHSSFTDGTGARRSQTSTSAPLGLAYGISSDFEVRLFYVLALDPTFTGKTFLDVRLSYTFFRGEHMSAAAQVRSGIDLANNDANPLRLGINALYRVSSTFAIFTPGEQLTIGLAGNGNRPITLDLPVGFGLQFTPQVFGSLTTNLAHISLANDGNDAFILSDMLRTDLAAFYSFSNRLDLGAHFDIDLKNSDFFVFGVLARGFF